MNPEYITSFHLCGYSSRLCMLFPSVCRDFFWVRTPLVALRKIINHWSINKANLGIYFFFIFLFGYISLGAGNRESPHKLEEWHTMNWFGCSLTYGVANQLRKPFLSKWMSAYPRVNLWFDGLDQVSVGPTWIKRTRSKLISAHDHISKVVYPFLFLFFCYFGYCKTLYWLVWDVLVLGWHFGLFQSF